MRGGPKIDAQPSNNTELSEIRCAKEVRERKGGTEQVLGAHHLRTRKRLEGLKDVILGGIGKAVEQQIHGQEKETPATVSRIHHPVLIQFRCIGLRAAIETAVGSRPRLIQRRRFAHRLKSRGVPFGKNGRVMERKDGDARRDERHNGIFIQRILFPKDGEMEGHDG